MEGWFENGLLWQCNHFQVLNFRRKTINHSPCQSDVWLIPVVNMGKDTKDIWVRITWLKKKNKKPLKAIITYFSPLVWINVLNFFYHQLFNYILAMSIFFILYILLYNMYRYINELKPDTYTKIIIGYKKLC